MAKIICAGGAIDVPIANSEVLYIKRTASYENHEKLDVGSRIPAPFSVPVVRLLKFAYLMRRIRSDVSEGTLTIRCAGGRQLLCIELVARDQLVVSFSHVVGFSGDVRFTSLANLSVAACSCDRNFISVAQGPGMVILETHGNHLVHETGTVELNPGQLVAWDPAMCFTFAKIRSIPDLYLNQTRVSCAVINGMSPLIVDSVPEKDATLSSGLLSFFKTVYLPRLH